MLRDQSGKGISSMQSIVSWGKTDLWGSKWGQSPFLLCALFLAEIRAPACPSPMPNFCSKFAFCLAFIKTWTLARGRFTDISKYLNFLSEDGSELQFHTVPPDRSIKVSLNLSSQHFRGDGWEMEDTSQPADNIYSCVSLSGADGELRLLVAQITAKCFLDSILKGEKQCQFSGRKILTGWSRRVLKACLFFE